MLVGFYVLRREKEKGKLIKKGGDRENQITRFNRVENKNR